jgi:MFS family permease
MHFEDIKASPVEATSADSGPWHKDLTRYHWFVLVVAALGWLFDTMDQQLFALARVPAMKQLLPAEAGGVPSKESVAYYAGLATAIFLIGWAVGGIAFGILGDRIGRARTMLFTILIYSLFTGLSAFSQGFWDFAFFRFLTGLGVGGEFAVGVALVAEVMPDRVRARALGWLQALSAIGNISAAFISLGFNHIPEETLQRLSFGDVAVRPWRLMFLVGAVPALLALFIRAGPMGSGRRRRSGGSPSRIA